MGQMRTRSIFLLMIAMLLWNAALSTADEKPEMLFFYSQDCDHCRLIKKEFIPGFLEKYGSVINFKEMDVEVEANIDSLFALEDRLQFPEDQKEYPAVYFLGTMLEGENPVAMRLETLVETYLANPDSMRAVNREVLARKPEPFVQVKTKEDAPVYAVYFFKQGCKECGRAEEIIERLKKSHKYLTVDVFDIGEERPKLLATALGIRASIPDNKLMSTPMLFIGDDVVLDDDMSLRTISALIGKYAETGSKPFWRNITDEDLEQVRDRISSLFDQFTVLAIMLAGLADGVNPCAFATILFFVSYLSMVGRKGREILVVGLSFAASVFITYFLVGLGFFKVIQGMAHFDILAKIIFGGTGALCIIFGVMSISDYFKARKGDVKDMALQLPAFLKKRIHATIREKARMESFIAGAFIAGFMVSILEFACTGQIYLPAITLVAKQEGITSIAVLYLLLYNLCFILPLLIVFAFVYYGMSSQMIAKKMETRTATVKLILAVVFFVVGTLLIITAF